MKPYKPDTSNQLKLPEDNGELVKILWFLVESDILRVFDTNSKSLKAIDHVCENGDCIQFTTEHFERRNETVEESHD